MPLKKGDKNSGQFKPGVSGNPAGGPKLPEDLRKLMRDTSNDLKRQICEVVQLTVGEMNQISESSESGMPVFKAALISLIKNSVNNGDDRGIKIVMDRILGRVPDAPPISDDDDNPSGLDPSKDDTIKKLVDLIVQEKK